MWHAGDIKPESVRTVGIDGRAIAAGGPAGEIEQRSFVLLGRGGEGEEMRTDGARIGEAETGEEALVPTGRIDRGKNEPVLLTADQRERPVIG